MPAVVIAAAINAAGSYLALTATQVFIAQVGASLILSNYQQRKAERKARDAWNASLRDRMQMVDITPNASAQLVLGRVRTVEGIRRRWTSGEHGETLTLVISFAGHEVDGFETFFLADLPVTLDVDGYVQTAPYLKGGVRSEQEPLTLDGSGLGSYGIPGAVVPGSVSVAYQQGGEGSTPEFVVLPGNVVNVTGDPAYGPVSINWQVYTGTSHVRIRTWSGMDGQNVGATLHYEHPDEIALTDRFDGIAVAVVDLLYDPDVFPQGIPNITALMRGARVLDPRTSTTAFSEDPALLAYHYARHPLGWAVPAYEIRTSDVNAAATVCEVATDFPLRKGDDSLVTVTLPRYRCGITIDTAGDPRAAMDEIFEAMAGRWGWAGGTWRMRPGYSAAPVFAMDQSWIGLPLDDQGNLPDTPLVRLSNGVARENKVNSVSGVCVDPDERWQVLPFPAVTDDTLVAAEGEYPIELEYQGVNHIAHAQQLGRIAVRSGQASLRMDASCNLNAWRCELFDVGAFTMPRYGMDGKLFEVTGWRWHPTQGVQLGMAETAAEIFEVAELTGRDPAPNTTLPSLFDVPDIELLTPESGTEHLLLLRDGTILSRLLIKWTPVVQEAVRRGGHIEVRYGRAGEDPSTWQTVTTPGEDSQLYLTGVQDGTVYVFTARASNSLVAGKWATQVAHLVLGKSAPASDVTGLAGTLNMGRITWTWDACTDLDYGETEVRLGGSDWDTATLAFKGRATTWVQEILVADDYTARVRHIDQSGNYSAATASLTVAGAPVNSKIVQLVATSTLFKIAPDGASTPASLNILAFGYNLTGAPAFTIEEGSATLSGTGTARTLSESAMATDVVTIKCTWDGAVSYVTITKVRDGVDGAGSGSATFTWVLTGTAVSDSGTSIRNGSPIDATAAGHSVESYIGGAQASFKVGVTKDFMSCGLSIGSTGSPGYGWSFFESGTALASPPSGGYSTTHTTDDTFAVLYDGTNVKWFKNGTEVRSVSVGTGQTFYLAASVNGAGARFNSVSFSGSVTGAVIHNYRQEGDPGAVPDGSTWTVPSTGRSYIRQGGAWIPYVGPGSITTVDLQAQAVSSNGVTLNSSSTSGGSGTGDSVSVGFFVGPTISLDAGDLLDINVLGLHNQAVLSQVDTIRRVDNFQTEVWLQIQRGAETPIEIGKRVKLASPAKGPNLETPIPIPIAAQATPGAGAWALTCFYTVKGLTDQGLLANRNNGFETSGQWGIKRIKR